MTNYQGKWEYEQTGTNYIEHPDEYIEQWVVDVPASTNQVIDYYKCSCGATK